MEKKNHYVCVSQITWAEQEADCDTFKYTKRVLWRKEK